MRRGWIALSVLLAASTARAQPAPPKTPASLPVRASTITLENGVVKASFGFRDAVDPAIAAKLQNGLPTVVTLRGYLFRDGATDPIALAARTCRVVYDLWEEVFRIEIVQAGGVVQTGAVNVEGVIRSCCEPKHLPLVDRARLARGVSYFVASLVEVNPVSQSTLDRIRLWVTHPNATTAIGPGDSLFGSFVGLFVPRIGGAERTLAFRTAAFLAPDPPPPTP
jgi:hypothetical protein